MELCNAIVTIVRGKISQGNCFIRNGKAQWDELGPSCMPQYERLFALNENEIITDLRAFDTTSSFPIML